MWQLRTGFPLTKKLFSTSIKKVRSPLPSAWFTFQHYHSTLDNRNNKPITMTDIPKTQKAVIFETNGGPLEYKDIAVPTPKSNELLIHVKYSGVCHTDLHAWKGDWPLPTKLPLVGGQ